MGWIKDIWDIVREESKPAIDSGLRKYVSDKEKKAILGRFAKEFASHDPDTTDLLDYYSWLEHPNDWAKGSGRLLFTTHREIETLWAKSKLIAPYEAALVRYIENEGTVSRLFVLGAEYFDPNARTLHISVMLRHQLLGFSPRVTSVLDLKDAVRSLGVTCEMFGSFNDLAAYFLSFSADNVPFFVRTTHKKFKQRAADCHSELLTDSESFETWYSHQPIRLTKAQLKEVELQCELIHEISRQHKDT